MSTEKPGQWTLRSMYWSVHQIFQCRPSVFGDEQEQKFLWHVLKTIISNIAYILQDQPGDKRKKTLSIILGKKFTSLWIENIGIKRMTPQIGPARLVKVTFQNYWIIAAVIFWPTDLFGVLIPPSLYS